MVSCSESIRVFVLMIVTMIMDGMREKSLWFRKQWVAMCVCECNVMSMMLDDAAVETGCVTVSSLYTCDLNGRNSDQDPGDLLLRITCCPWIGRSSVCTANGPKGRG